MRDKAFDVITVSLAEQGYCRTLGDNTVAAPGAVDAHQSLLANGAAGSGRVARPFGFALTDPGRRLSRTRLFPEVTRIGPLVPPRDA